MTTRTSAAPAFETAIGTADPQAWDRLAAQHFYSSSRWLSLCRLDPQGIAGGVHIGHPDDPDAALAVTEMLAEVNPFYRWSDVLESRGVRAPAERGLMIGQRRGYQTHVLRKPSLDARDAAAALLPAIRELAADEPAVAMHLTWADVLAFQAAGVTAPPVLLELDAWLPVTPDGLDGYLGRLNRGRRANVRADRRKFAASGFVVEHTTLDQCVDDAARLLASTQGRYGVALDPSAVATELRIHAAAMGDDAQVVIARDENGTAIGFTLFYVWGRTLYIRAIGFDYPVLRDAAEYFNLVYYLPIEAAAAQGADWVHVGIAAAEAKALRGAELRGTWMLDLSADSVLHDQVDAVRASNRTFLEGLANGSAAVVSALTLDASALLS